MRKNLAEIIGRLKEIPNVEITENAEMKKYCSFRAGGTADALVEPMDIDALRQTMEVLRDSGEEYIVMGNGSNILIRDGGYRGIIIRLERLEKIEVEGDRIWCEAGALLSVIAKTALNESLTGFEFASGIPGSIGGGVFMNAGAYDGEMKQVVLSCTVIDRITGELKTLSVDELELSYRHSILQETGDIVVSVVLQLTKGDADAISDRMKELAEKRNSKQPLQYPSAGSFFKRPQGYFAGKLIQDAGCKGLSVGGAQISELHSGFMINTGNATATDILTLMKLVQNTVYDKFGVMMEPEVRIIGEE